MNERIKELFEQAHIQPPATRSGQFAFTPPKTFSPEKFAELIVGECMELVEGYTKQRTHTTFYKAEEQIKQHFGVEE